MPPRNRAKLGLTIPVDPKYSRGFDTSSYGNNNVLTSPSSASAVQPSPSRRNIPRSPRPQSSPKPIPPPPPAPMRRMQQAAEKSRLEKEEAEELESLVNAPPFSRSGKKLTKQLSLCETHRDVAWEKRRRQIFRQEKRRNSISVVERPTPTPDLAPPQAAMPGSVDGEKLTDADLHELKGSIELGFGFNEEEGQKLCNTLPALDLYFAVNRQVSLSPVSTPRLAPAVKSFDSPRSDDWRICGKGDDPQQVKTNLRHWAQAVACSIMQTF